MSITDITGIIFSVLGSVWSFISNNQLLTFAVFFPVVVGSVVLIIRHVR